MFIGIMMMLLGIASAIVLKDATFGIVMVLMGLALIREVKKHGSWEAFKRFYE